jgi:hypothetical protein
MLKSMMLVVSIASAAGGVSVQSASATSFSDVPRHTTAALCRKLYDEARSESKSSRDAKDAYITCVGRL